MEQSARGNFFDEQNQIICRLDQLSRNEDYLAKLGVTEWDLIIVDEAHKMAAHYSGGEINETDRFKLGKKLGSIARGATSKGANFICLAINSQANVNHMD